MIKLKDIVGYVVNNFQNEIDGKDISNYRDMLDYLGLDSKDMKLEVLYLFNEYDNKHNQDSEYPFYLDDGSVIDDDNIISYRQFMNLVRKGLFTSE